MVVGWRYTVLPCLHVGVLVCVCCLCVAAPTNALCPIGVCSLAGQVDVTRPAAATLLPPTYLCRAASSVLLSICWCCCVCVRVRDCMCVLLLLLLRDQPGLDPVPSAAGYPGPQQHMHPGPPPPSLSAQSGSCFARLMEMGCGEPDRRAWLEHYMTFMEDIGKPLTGLPQVVKQPLDLYRFYLAVRERGGVLEVIKAKRWKEISQLVNINASASAAYTLRKNYCKYLLDYECRFDRGIVDTRPVLAQIDSLSGGGKKKRASVGSGGSTGGAPGSGGIPPDESSASSNPTLDFPPLAPSPVGSQSSASSNLLPPPNGNGSGGVAGLKGSPQTGPGHPDGYSASSTPTPGDGGPQQTPPISSGNFAGGGPSPGVAGVGGYVGGPAWRSQQQQQAPPPHHQQPQQLPPRPPYGSPAGCYPPMPPGAQPHHPECLAVSTYFLSP